MADQIKEVSPSSSPLTSRITDYFPASPKPQKGKLQDFKVKKEQKPVQKIPNGLLTPEASPVKDGMATANVKEEKSDSDSQSSVDLPSKQVILENGTAVKSEKGKKNKKVSDSTTTNGTSESTSRKGRKKSSKKNAESDQLNNSLVTDYFPIRRSNRRCKSEIEKEVWTDIEDKILNKKEDGLKIVEMENKGRGIVSTKAFQRGEFVVEYAGDLIALSDAKEKERIYSEIPETGCYMYYFHHKNHSYCIDATAESGRLGRLINHSRTSANCRTKLVEVNNTPYLTLVAARDISLGEELLYDYGDRSKTSVESHPWLKL
ncbi:N-lysine methyltransferase KMT5A-B-like [Mizuhopecten yessoensis]|uniref:[histone H4]-lysine(20) N-methyltransferase n=1 Tax=Mizuhopecten yessoensis TaxID=6573 RepID=A0A210QYM7_MIZYE|nr:N-lysine methyltransferase KMT5A-B-like [Mizuhopecten yessoensis]XP_021346318.1 N-lysine methyltransferase KMT5A-B-like [Mizuhopecten yessoensis]OWF53893.1 Protein strawberry notch-like 1 [Mizuhopecten yessoensis]